MIRMPARLYGESQAISGANSTALGIYESELLMVEGAVGDSYVKTPGR
jgi:hypothetical protein